jgi:diguanylate cyclase (GGDEF)-like protein
LLGIVHADDRPIVEEAIAAALHRQQPFNVDFRIVRPDDTIRIVREHGEVQFDSAGKPVRMQGTTQDITERKRAEEQIHRLAMYDSLTGLPNRHLFKEQLIQAVARAGRTEEGLAVLSLDLDRFKRVNDTLGHEVGDLLLKEAASRLARTLRQTDYITRNDLDEVNCLVARQGGDEFTVLLGGLDQAQDTAKVARRILDTLSQPFVLDGKEIVMSASIGIAVHPLDGTDADSLLKNAGAAVHYAKQQGRNYQYYNSETNAAALENLALESRLRKALEKEEFALHYQPKVDLATGRLCGLEALIRWNDPETGLVPPAKFIPLLEETGMIREVGHWVMRKAVTEYEGWHRQGLQPPRIAVNVSPIQLRQKDFVDSVRKALEGSNAGSHGLDLEITESLVMEDIQDNIEKLRAMKDMGVNVAIDDFGTGYSSLGYLARLPVNTLKIDRSFIVTMAQSANSMTIVSTIISLAHSLGLKVVAEGVDAEEQRKLLKLLKCDEMQGYLFSRPVPASEVETLLAARRSSE